MKLFLTVLTMLNLSSTTFAAAVRPAEDVPPSDLSFCCIQLDGSKILLHGSTASLENGNLSILQVTSNQWEALNETLVGSFPEANCTITGLGMGAPSCN